MMKYRLQVTANALNKRSRIPASLPDDSGIVGVVLLGFSFIGERVHPAELNGATERWYRDRDGYYYMGRWLMETQEIPSLEVVKEVKAAPVKAAPPAEVAVQFDPNKMSWGHKLYDIPSIWDELGTKGKGATIAVIDTGIDNNHEDLIPNIDPQSRSFIGDINNILDTDTKNHGTRMAGIIAGTGTNKVFGIAPESKLLVVKATLKKVNANVNVFTEAVKFVATLPEVDIVSISYTLENTPQFKQAIDECIAANKIVVAAIGNLRDNDLPEDPDTFPSSYNSGKNNINGNEVIAVGSMNKLKQVSGFSNWNSHLSFITPGEEILTANGNNSATLEDGTSISTAFTAGCLALMVSYSKLNNKPIINCARALLNTCDDIGPTVGFDFMSGFGILNLRNAIAKIK